MKQIITIAIAAITLYSCNLKGIKSDSDSDLSGLGIAYNVAVKDSLGKTNYEVYTMNAEGSGKKNITRNPDVAWAYKGYKKDLFFISDRDTSYRCFFLYRTDINGKDVRKVSNLRLEDSWMDFREEGKEAIVSARIGKDIRYQLFLLNTGTGSYEQLTNDTSAVFSDPAFSPDGKQIAFIYKKNKRDRLQNEEIFVMNSDGIGLKQLTHYPPDNISRDSSGYKAGSPHWHPTGNFISYISMQDGKHSIFAVTPDGKEQWKLTDNRFSEGWHDWSPDGNWLTFDKTEDNSDQYEIMLMNWSTKELKQLTNAEFKSQLSPIFILKD